MCKILEVFECFAGGPGAAHEAEEFAWNDHTVIPVQVTGGAAGGSFGVPSNIFQVQYRCETQHAKMSCVC